MPSPHSPAPDGAPRRSLRPWLGVAAVAAGAGLGLLTLIAATQSSRPVAVRAGLELGGMTLVLERLQTGDVHVRIR